jgi:hypothetical protein
MPSMTVITVGLWAEDIALEAQIDRPVGSSGDPIAARAGMDKGHMNVREAGK